MPIYYEARLPELHIEGPATLDSLFEAMFDDLSEDDQARIRRRYANKETVAEAEKRIEMIALDISRHFKAKIKPNGFKAQVVAPSRAAALRYAERLNDFNLNAYPIITTSPNDGTEFADARDLNQEQVTSAFVDPEGEPEILVVVDMLLTGFDAPVEQVLYLDKGLREHGLLQAIARVNRRFSHKPDNVDTEKPHGLVVDYHGGLAGPGGGAGDVRMAGRAGIDGETGGGSGAGDRGGGGAGGVALQGTRPRQRVGLRGGVRAGRVE